MTRGASWALLHAVDYDFPADRPVSDSVKSLLGRMLVADASKRATLLEIEQHPWFRKDMPPELDVGTFNASYLRLSDSVEHANSIRRCVSGGVLTAHWLWHDAAMSGAHAGRAGTWGTAPRPWVAVMKVAATHVAGTDASLSVAIMPRVGAGWSGRRWQPHNPPKGTPSRTSTTRADSATAPSIADQTRVVSLGQAIRVRPVAAMREP